MPEKRQFLNDNLVLLRIKINEVMENKLTQALSQICMHSVWDVRDACTIGVPIDALTKNTITLPYPEESGHEQYVPEIKPFCTHMSSNTSSTP